MKYNRKLAALILVLCIVGTVLISGGRSLRQYRETQSELFYMGPKGFSIYNDLMARCEAGYNIITVARRYMDANSVDLASLADAITAVENAQGPSESYEANYRLTVAADQVYALLSQQNLSDADKKLLSGQFTEMTSRNQTIANDSYNTTAGKFNDLLKGFPTGLIAGINGIRPLELFR